MLARPVKPTERRLGGQAPSPNPNPMNHLVCSANAHQARPTHRAVRREMARVYRAMKGKAIDTQDGTRLVYVLTQIAKLHEAVEIERRVQELERLTNEHQ